MMNKWLRFWRSLDDKEQRDKLAFIGKPLVVVAMAVWAILVYLKPPATPVNEPVVSSSVSTPVNEQITKDQLSQAERLLNTGRYRDAKLLFEKIEPKNERAQWGQKVAAAKSTGTPFAFKQTIDALYEERPGDAVVNLFLGEYYALGEHDGAKADSYYRAAIKLNPQLVEAYFDLAVLYFGQDKWAAAQELLEKEPVKQSATPKYRGLLASVYVKQGLDDKALREYGNISGYPLAALESAKIYWRQQRWADAVKRVKQALTWLDDQKLMAQTENQEFWHVELASAQSPAQRQASTLVKLDEKKRYALYCLAVSLFLQGDTNGADALLKQADASHDDEVKDIIRADLAELAAKSDLDEPVAAFERRYLP